MLLVATSNKFALSDIKKYAEKQFNLIAGLTCRNAGISEIKALPGKTYWGS
jgi:hypothetical protein